MNTGKETGRYTEMQGFSTEQRSREGETTAVKDIKKRFRQRRVATRG